MSSQVQVSVKTKAKKRYLKRKRERRKVRAKAKVRTLSAMGTGQAGEEEEDGWEDIEKDGNVDVESNTAVDVNERPRRSRKRRKVEDVSEVQQDMDMDVDFNVDSVQSSSRNKTQGDHNERKECSPSRSPSPNSVGVLPSFPLPMLPNAPSKTDLALQGLDKALIDAEVVSEGSSGIALGLLDLSERMKRRLKELGITDLFAGVSSLSVFQVTVRKLACSPEGVIALPFIRSYW